MRNKKLIILVILFSVLIITKLLASYSSVHMVYKLKDGESSKEVAERFKVSEYRVDGQYMMFEVR